MDEVPRERFFEDQPAGERWDPLGAPDDQHAEKKLNQEYCEETTYERIKHLEEEQELLNSSLCALTTHFAQVQFRLRQVVNASLENKEELLKSLEEFAFRGIPDVVLVKERMEDASLAEAVRLQRSQQKELIDRLKFQLKELEQYAFENGEAGVPQDVILERQRVIVSELKSRMNFELDERNYHQMTSADVRQQINIALDQLVSPIRVKEHLVVQLKTQVADLERFINYLQSDMNHDKCSCGCAYHSLKRPFKVDAIGIIQRTATLLQMFAVLQLGCGLQSFKKNDVQNNPRGNHWGDLRAKLEMAIYHVKELVSEEGKHFHSDYSSDCEISASVGSYHSQLTFAVRKYLAGSIRDLIEHGATNVNNPSLVPFIGCFPKKITRVETQVHAWEIILEYYHMKNGDKFNATPARKLSQSFNLDIAGTSLSSNKHNMLCTVGNIISTHTPYKRSYDSHFKAFICAALNSNKLVSWLGLIFQCSQILRLHYYPWSYVVKTGFVDSLKSLDVLTSYKFDLPVDLAVRQFQNIKDVFT